MKSGGGGGCTGLRELGGKLTWNIILVRKKNELKIF